MAKSQERKIVDVRDLFGEKKEKIDLPELINSSSTSTSAPPSKATPSLWTGGITSGALGGYKPKACASTNDNVFFGGTPSGGRSERSDNNKSNKTPVLVDIDVGINDQHIGDYGESNVASVDRPESPVVGKSTSSADSPWSFGPPKTKTSSSSSSRDQLAPPRGMSGQVRKEAGGGGGGGAVSGKPVVKSTQQYSGSDHRSGRETPQTRGLPHGGQSQLKPKTNSHQGQEANGLMSSLNLGQRQQEGRFGMKNEVQRDKRNIYIDQSSSGVETDENSTPEGTAVMSKAVAMSKRPLPPLPTQDQSPPPPPPLPPSSKSPQQIQHQQQLQQKQQQHQIQLQQQQQQLKQQQQEKQQILHKEDLVNQSSKVSNGTSQSQGVDSSYHSEEASDAEDEGSDFYEDEMTLDFEEEDDEEGTYDGGRRVIYQEYQGDDFGQFLKEEHAAGEQGVAPRGKKKRLRRRKKKEVASSPGNSTASVSSGEATINKKRTLKGRIAAVFMGNNGNTAAPKEVPPQKPSNRFDSGNTIHSFSFADSKIGNTLTRTNASQLNGTSGSGLAPCDAAYGGDRKWWKIDTLSARTLQSNSDVLLMPRRSGTNGDTGNSSSNFSFKKAESVEPETFDTFNDENEGPDFESLRKSVIYGVSDDRKSRKGSIFHRLKKDSKVNSNFHQDNTVTNPLASLQ